MDLLLKKMHSPEDYENRTRPWIVRNKLIGQVQFGKEKKRVPCVSLFSGKMEEVPKECWKALKVKGMRKVLVCSKTLSFISAAKCEFHWDKGDNVVTHAFVDCIRDDFKPADKKVFWKHQMELYFQLINSHYENVQEIDKATIEEITEELQQVDIIEAEKKSAQASQAAQAAETASQAAEMGDESRLPAESAPELRSE